MSGIKDLVQVVPVPAGTFGVAIDVARALHDSSLGKYWSAHKTSSD
jgi:hypothetical protein